MLEYQNMQGPHLAIFILYFQYVSPVFLLRVFFLYFILIEKYNVLALCNFASCSLFLYCLDRFFSHFNKFHVSNIYCTALMGFLL